MTKLEQRILDNVRGSLGADRLAGAIVYLDYNLIHAYEQVQVGDAVMKVPWDAYIAFVDLEPGVNWGHACCYLAIRRDADDVMRVTANMPPFLKARTSTFRLLWCGPLAPEWAVVKNSD
jgi:hypothetical protein